MPDETKAVRQPPTPKPQPESLAPNYAAFMSGGQQAFTRWMQGMFTLSQEITRFTQGRVQEDMAAWWALASCRSPEEAANCQQRFAAKAVEEYSEEMTKLSQMMMKVATEGLASVPTLHG
jgi:hypothetical protein